MEPFVPKVVITQSADGKTLTITDQSNFDTNTDGVSVGDISQFGISIFDKSSNLLQQLNMNYPTATYAITRDLFLRFHLAYVDGATTYQADVKFLSTQFYSIAERKVAAKIACDCGCNDLLCYPASKALQNKNAAITAFLTGDDVSAQQAIHDANTLIQQALKKC